MEIHRILGGGLSEIVYKDALEFELKTNNIHYEREKGYVIEYKGAILPHSFCADFVIFNKVIAEIKAQKDIVKDHYNQVINYLKISKCPVGLIINFGGDSLDTKRVIV